MDLEADDSAAVAALADLHDLLAQATDADRARAAKRRRLFAVVALGLLLPIAIWLTAGWYPVAGTAVVLVWALLFLILPGSSLFPILRRYAPFDGHLSADQLRALRDIDNPLAIGMLIDAEGESSGQLQDAIHAALTRLLPLVAAPASPLLESSRYQRLYTHLDAFARLGNYNARPTEFAAYPLGGTWERPRVITDTFPELREEYERFLLAILAGLATLGTADTVAHIEAIVRIEAPSEQYARIQKAALMTLASIQARLEAERVGRTLLRPTAEPTDSLVRPARSPAESDPESLLRPAIEE